MSENNNSQSSAATQPTPVGPVSGRKQLWIIATVVVVLAVGAYAWWAKPKFLFGESSSMQAGGAPGMNGPGGAPGGGFGGGGPGGFGGGGPGGGRGGQTAPVGAAKARMTDVNIYVPALGSVVAQNTATVRVRTDGQVLMKLHFKEGEMVKEGQLLAELDSRSAEVQLALAQGQQARDLAQLQNAKIDLERYRNLLAQDSIAKQLVDTQEAQVRQIEGTAKIDQANVDAARLQLSYTKVTAPISGRVGLKQIDVGNVARSSDVNGVAIITQVQPLNVVFTIPEVNIPRVLKQLQDGVELPVEAWDREQKNKIASGVLVTVDNQIDATTGTIKLKGRFENKDLALFPNQFVNVRMLLEVRHDATVVPTSAIQRGTEGNFVYIVKQDKSIAVRNVVAGAVQGEDTMIADHSVKPGEIVVIDGTDRLREGMKVEAIVRAETPVALPTEAQINARNRARRMQQMGGDPSKMSRAGGGMPAGAPVPGGDVAKGPAANPGGGAPQGFGGNRPMNPDGTPRQWTGPRPDGQGSGAPVNPDGTPRQFNGPRPDGQQGQIQGQGFGGPRTNPDGTPRQRSGGQGNPPANAPAAP